MIHGRTRKRQSQITISWKQGIKIFFLFFLFLMSVFFVNKIKETNKFPITHVTVYGMNHLDQAEIQHLMTPLVSKGFFAVEVEFIKEQLTRLPWVSDVSVRRVWPDQVIVAISERQPIALWNENSLLSSTGEIFSPEASSMPKTLPHFLGPEGEQIHMLEFYTKIDQILHPLHLKITRLELTPYLSWNVIFDSGMIVHVGYKDVLTRINHFVKVYPKIVGKRATDVDYVDLRYPNGLAVRWKTVT